MVKSRKNKFLVEAKKSEVEVIPVVSPRESIQPQDMSLDQKVDRYFIQYEREAIKKSEMFNGLGQTPRASAPLAIAQLQENKKEFNLFSILILFLSFLNFDSFNFCTLDVFVELPCSVKQMKRSNQKWNHA